MELVVKQHFHIDNGGFTFAVFKDEKENFSIVITDSYYGYSEHKLTLNARVDVDTLESLSNMFAIAAQQLKVRKLFQNRPSATTPVSPEKT